MRTWTWDFICGQGSGKGAFSAEVSWATTWASRKGASEASPRLLSAFLLPAARACVCVCWFNCKIYLAPWPPVSSRSCPPLQFVILRGVYVAAQHLSFILLSIDIKLPRKELSLSLRSCSNGSFFTALGSPFISLQFASGMVLQWGHLHLWSPSLSLFDFSLRFSLRVRNHCIVIYHTFL